MRIRRGALAVSSILFTLALLLLTPIMLRSARTTYQTRYRDITVYPEAGIALDQVVIPNYDAPFGITSLAIVSIGLVVTWAGYVKGVRWTWFVMFVIVWVWAFPALVLPMFLIWQGWALMPPSIARAIEEILHAGPYTDSGGFLETLVAFLLMVLALALPAKSFIAGHGPGRARPVANP